MLEIYPTLCGFQIESNIPGLRKHIADGVLLDTEGQPMKEGDEIEYNRYKGLLIIRDGLEVVKKLIEWKMLDPNNIDEFRPAKEKDELFEYILKNGSKDGSFIFNSRTGMIAPVCTMNNSPPDMPEVDLYKDCIIPEDFIYHDNSVPNARIGNKTHVGIVAAMTVPGVKSYLIKRSAYGETGIGKVVEIGPQGLERELYFGRKGAGIVAKERTYSRNGTLNREEFSRGIVEI